MKVHISKEDMVQIDQQEMMAPDSICFQHLNISSRSDIFVGLQQKNLKTMCILSEKKL